MITRFVTSADGTRLAVMLDGDETKPTLLTISPWATVSTPAELLGHDVHAPHRSRRSWVSFDRRGTGASQRDVTDVSIDAQLADVAAVLSAVSAETCDITAYFEASPVAIAYAARFPDRVRRLVLWQPFVQGKDFLPHERIRSLIGITHADWPLATRTLANLWVPRGPVDVQRNMARSFRERLSPQTMVQYLEQYLTIDVREEARLVTAPTLVLHPAGAGIPSQPPQEVASLIPNAVLQHAEQSISFIASEEVAGRVIDFFDGKDGEISTSRREQSSLTAIILFADIAGSTATTERIGDAAFRDASRALDLALRSAIRANGGTAIDGKTLGDGVLATFPSAAQAISAALTLEAAAEPTGLELHIGLHAGDVIREANNVFGGAVTIASRISDLAPPGEVWVSRTVADLARTSAGVEFEDRGEQEMKGVGEPVRVYAVRGHVMSGEPQIQYALTEDGVSIAYWTYGEGKPFVLPPGGSGVPSLRVWRTTEGRQFIERMAAHRMIVRYDARGFGNSQAGLLDFTLESRVRDLAAVIEKLGVEEVNLCGYVESGPAAIAYVAQHPERVSRLILWASSVRETNYVSDEVMKVLHQLAQLDFELYREAMLAAVVRYLGRNEQAYEYAQSLRETFIETFKPSPPFDVSDDLLRIAVPTLVLHRRGMKVPSMGEVQKIAASIPNARLTLLEGESASPYSGDTDAVLAAIEEFLGDGDSLALNPADGATRGLPEGTNATGTAVILFTDIVSSTALTERLGDARFRDASRALDVDLRAAIRDAGGGAVDGKLLGDGVLATFPSAAQAIDGARRCLALSAASELGLHIGLHAGDVIREEGNVFGGAVNIASRICGLSAPGEILVSDVVRGMARSSAGVEFEDRGEHEMKGVGEPVRVYAVRGQE